MMGIWPWPWSSWRTDRDGTTTVPVPDRWSEQHQSGEEPTMPIAPHDLIANVGDLPPLPQVADHVLRLSANPGAPARAFHQVIALDPALASQVLKTSNSTAFGMM